MLLGKVQIDPARSPAVLDTATWDPAGAAREIHRRRHEWREAVQDGKRARLSSAVTRHGQVVFLAGLADSQRVFLQAGPPAEGLIGEPFTRLDLGGGMVLLAFPADEAVIDRFCRTMAPPNAPRPLGRTPRLGIGSRMTTRLWPGVFAAMDRGGFAANAIQNSVRELNLLGDLRAAAPPQRIYSSGFAMIESGYTGSTFEGLWVEGVLAALELGRPLRYGADADHIQVKRADAQLERALRVVEAARYYTFFTLDVADLLSHGALGGAASGEELARRVIPDENERREVFSWHREAAGGLAPLSPDLVGRCAGKYWAALHAADVLAGRISKLRPGIPVDLEFAFDEHPPEIAGPDCISSDAELLFVAREIARRGLPVTHLAPNFGVEKGFDYRLADGREGLEKRIASQHRAAEALGFMLDVHSADDLGSQTRKVIRRATAGNIHYKISPSLHLLFAQTVHDCAPKVFRPWWDGAVEYARTEAGRGSRFAADCLLEWESGEHTPSPSREVFRHFFFAWPGRRDGDGRFVNREMLYTLPRELYDEYQRRVESFLGVLSEDLFDR